MGHRVGGTVGRGGGGGGGGVEEEDKRPHLAIRHRPTGFPVTSHTALWNSVAMAFLMHHAFLCSLCW